MLCKGKNKKVQKNMRFWVGVFSCFILKKFLRVFVESIIIFPLDFLYLCAILAQTVALVCKVSSVVKVCLQGHSSTVEYRSPKPRMRVRFLLPLPVITVFSYRRIYEENT